MDTDDLSRPKVVTPIAPGETVLVAEKASRDRQGRWGGHPPREEAQKHAQLSPSDQGEDNPPEKKASEGRIIDIVI